MTVRKEDTVVATFDEEELFMRLEDGCEGKLAEYIREHGLADIIVLSAVGWLRDWYDDFGDKEWCAMEHAMERHIGKEKFEELREW
ncbi:MAG: hypothetical protein IJ087_01325 [Eggerthellaceae bacterium]|nr:hypothetical protein [Eggerthellaceae bacterium]